MIHFEKVTDTPQLGRPVMYLNLAYVVSVANHLSAECLHQDCEARSELITASGETYYSASHPLDILAGLR